MGKDLGPKEAMLKQQREDNWATKHDAGPPQRVDTLSPVTHKRPTLVTKEVTPVTKPVTVTPQVTRTVTGPVTPCKECERLKLEVAMLRDEVATLQARLAEAGGKAPMTGAEKMRRLRERRRKAKEAKHA